jgi:hypothetical protein
VLAVLAFLKAYLTKPPTLTTAIQGKAFAFSGYGGQHDSLPGVTDFSFRLTLCNHRLDGITLKGIVLNGSALEPGVTFSQINRAGKLCLKYGVAQTLDIQAVATNLRGEGESDLARWPESCRDRFPGKPTPH